MNVGAAARARAARASTVPPCSSTSRLDQRQARARGRRRARSSAAVALHERLEQPRQQRRRRCPSRCPRTREHRLVSVGAERSTGRGPPAGVNLAALVSRFAEHLRDADGVGVRRRAARSAARASSVTPRARGAGGCPRASRAPASSRSTRSRCSWILSLRDARDVEQVVDQAHQVVDLAIDDRRARRAIASPPGASVLEHVQAGADRAPAGCAARARARAMNSFFRAIGRAQLVEQPPLRGDVVVDGRARDRPVRLARRAAR